MSISTTELTFNLWAIYDGVSHVVYGLCGKAYNLSGSDEEKLLLLKQLSSTDYVTAKRHKVPERFIITYDDGECIKGATSPQAIHHKESMLFEEVFVSVVTALPPIPIFTESNYQAQEQVVPDDPLCVTTLLYENEKGEIRPILTEEDRNWLLRIEEFPL